MNAAIFREPNAIAFNIKLPVQTDKAFGLEIRHPRVYTRVGAYLTKMLRAEVNHGQHMKLKVAPSEQHSLKDRFEKQYKAYACGLFPFSVPLNDGQTALDWWKALEGVPQADILAVSDQYFRTYGTVLIIIAYQTLAVKLFSVTPNSMVEERTMSGFTWINSALRNALHIDTMTSAEQIRQYYRTTAEVILLSAA